MRSYPPHPVEVFEAFRGWLDADRRVRHVVIEEPDKAERERPEIDYVLAPDTARDQQIAAEVSSIWRSARAGKEDRDWDAWMRRVARLADGRLPGRYVAHTDLRIPRDLDPKSFADELVSVVVREDFMLTESARASRGATFGVCGMEVFISKRGSEAGGVSFARRFQPEDLDAFPRFVRSVLLDKKSPKLKVHKAQGRQTWLVIYNTLWTVKPASDLTPTVRSWLGPEHRHLDGIAFVEGDPPDDAWVTVLMPPPIQS